MIALAVSGDTWGISGQAFLLGYAVIAAVVWAAGIRARKAILDAPLEPPGVDPQARPYDIAYLNGGGELAVCAALGAMHRAGTVSSTKGTVGAAGRLGSDADELERAIHFTAATPLPWRRLQSHRVVGTALESIETRLVAGGLLLSDSARRQYRAVGWWMLGVAGLGLVRLLAGVAAAHPVGYLLVALLAVTAIGLVQLARAPRRSATGQRVLARLRSDHHGLAPAMAPDWTVYGPAGAALGVGLFGTSALWASDPAFAQEIALARAGTRDGSGAGSSCGGGSDGGSASCGGGSSDGGGGGCGGGGCGG